MLNTSGTVPGSGMLNSSGATGASGTVCGFDAVRGSGVLCGSGAMIGSGASCGSGLGASSAICRGVRVKEKVLSLFSAGATGTPGVVKRSFPFTVQSL